MTVLTPENHPSPVAISCSMLLTLCTPEPLKFTDGKSARGKRFIAAMTRAYDGHTSRVSICFAVKNIAQTHYLVLDHPPGR